MADPPGPPAPFVLVLHGLEGHARRPYVGTALRELHERGMAGAGLNFRGCSGEPNRTPRAYHSGETGDLAFVLERLRERHPDRALGALGFSLGGNVLLKLVGEEAEGVRDRLRAAAAISVPYDLAAGAELLERTPMGRLYSRYFLRSLVAKLREKRALLEGRVELDEAVRSRTIREFDERVTAPLHGFRNAAHYYRVSSSAGYLDGVRIPTLLLHARDDPFLPPDRIPERPAADNPFVRTVITRRGGHVGFVEGAPWAPDFWAERTVADFFARHLAPRRSVSSGRTDPRPPPPDSIG